MFVRQYYNITLTTNCSPTHLFLLSVSLHNFSDIFAGREVVWDPVNCNHGPGESPITEAPLCRAHDTDGCRFCRDSCVGFEVCNRHSPPMNPQPEIPRDTSLRGLKEVILLYCRGMNNSVSDHDVARLPSRRRLRLLLPLLAQSLRSRIASSSLPSLFVLLTRGRCWFYVDSDHCYLGLTKQIWKKLDRCLLRQKTQTNEGTSLYVFLNPHEIRWWQKLLCNCCLRALIST